MKDNFKKFVFALLPLFLLLLLAETGARYFYYERTGKNKGALAIIAVANEVRFKVLSKMASRFVATLPKEQNLWQALYSAQGKQLLDEFKARYEENFEKLNQEIVSNKAKLIVLYLPSDDYKNPEQLLFSKLNREFFKSLAEKYKVDYLDLTDIFFQYPEDQITLLPENGHLSRFGNQIVALELGNFLEKEGYKNQKSDFSFSKRPKIMGDLSPNDNTVWGYGPTMPYRVISNKQGFRMDYDLAFPKQKQRVLVLGDSFSFGPYLNNHDTYPVLLNKKYPEKEIINAGIASYTITDEVSLFLERAKFVEPDIVVLQVLDNDIPGFFASSMNKFNRKKISVVPSALEVDFLNKLK
ncbi:MAG: SGNH/GDSL hydrolase family protein [bacterium]